MTFFKTSSNRWYSSGFFGFGSFAAPLSLSFGSDITPPTARSTRPTSGARALDGPLQERPEVFHAVRVDVILYISFCMVNNLVRIVVQPVITFQRIGMQFRTWRHNFADDWLQVFLLTCRNMPNVNLAGFMVQQPKYDFLTYRATALDHLFPAPLVHESGLTADEGFVGLNRARHLVDGSGVHGVAQPMQHKPCGLLSYLQVAGDLVRRNAVLTVADHPHCTEP